MSLMRRRRDSGMKSYNPVKKNYNLPPITYDFNKLIKRYTDNIDENVFKIYQETSDMMEKYKYEITYLKELGQKLVVQDERGESDDMGILHDVNEVLEHFLLFQEIENDIENNNNNEKKKKNIIKTTTPLQTKFAHTKKRACRELLPRSPAPPAPPASAAGANARCMTSTSLRVFVSIPALVRV